MSIAALLLAAGQSTRFGAEDKLAVPLHGIPLGLHAARTLASMPFSTRIVVAAPATIAWPGFAVVTNDRPSDGMARSLALGIAAVRRSGATGVLVALADMPFVPRAHFEALLATCTGSESLTASSDGNRRMPPAVFGAEWFAGLEHQTGDQGARALLARGGCVTTHKRHLADIDRPEDFRAG